jgi:hypothetical protein
MLQKYKLFRTPFLTDEYGVSIKAKTAGLAVMMFIFCTGNGYAGDKSCGDRCHVSDDCGPGLACYDKACYPTSGGCKGWCCWGH